ncbi:type II toxin-antitoxin system prevent-host-death family antitoxin [Streptomyces cinereoruber]|uniref:type II toxin-antitoxin system prevent-host-death family antitoxin n=1 Tax=Streptomyces cinereoruber TaxID=67260 RepID=UPI003C2FDDC1
MSTRTEHRATIAEARNVFGEVVGRSRYGGDVTLLLNRTVEAAVVVPVDFYRRALEALGETAVPAVPDGGKQQDA